MHKTRSKAHGDNELYTYSTQGSASRILPERPLFPLLTYLIPRINCTPGSRSASLQNGPCTPTTQEGLKKKTIMQKN